MACTQKRANTELLKMLYTICILIVFSLSAVGIRYYISYVSFRRMIFVLYKVIIALILERVCHHGNLSRHD